ncbi:hypothetical protein NQ314_021400 [Rhamnusium bicolor]|uniref:Uncharacterized protein n=1 Tax=Rhamnusium bicolor TaxID=1586634 RepID=A0AAV8WID1_9CUCU|nr:hypothetical protein NQ314_021400 [Rhamnusium bicolor]
MAWLGKPPSQLKPFLANRVAEMISLTDLMPWKHVRTHDNPADVISRGMTPEKLATCSLWWHGPSW